MTPRDAFLGATERVPVDEAVGRVSAESIAGYPPGIPALLPGERITAEVIAYLRELVAAGARLHGAIDPAFESIYVVARAESRPWLRVSFSTGAPNLAPRCPRRRVRSVRDLVEAALAEDVGAGDVTTEATVPADARGVATITQKAPGVICGLDVAERGLPAAGSRAA